MNKFKMSILSILGILFLSTSISTVSAEYKPSTQEEIVEAVSKSINLVRSEIDEHYKNLFGVSDTDRYALNGLSLLTTELNNKIDRELELKFEDIKKLQLGGNRTDVNLEDEYFDFLLDFEDKDENNGILVVLKAPSGDIIEVEGTIYRIKPYVVKGDIDVQEKIKEEIKLKVKDGKADLLSYLKERKLTYLEIPKSLNETISFGVQGGVNVSTSIDLFSSLNYPIPDTSTSNYFDPNLFYFFGYLNGDKLAQINGGAQLKARGKSIFVSFGNRFYFLGDYSNKKSTYHSDIINTKKYTTVQMNTSIFGNYISLFVGILFFFIGLLAGRRFKNKQNEIKSMLTDRF